MQETSSEKFVPLTLDVMGYNVFYDDLNRLKVPVDGKIVINTINPHSYVTAKSDKAFAEALRCSDILLPDGSGIVLAAAQIRKQNMKKIAGADLHSYLLERLNETKGRCFYMGASPATLEKIRQRLASEYPEVDAGFYSPPYKPKFSDEENRQILEAIAAFKPDVLFVGMTAPKQEKWLFEHQDRLEVSVACSIGAVFDFYAGTVQRPSQFWIDMHLEWLPRFLKEPRRLWKRNFVSTPLFLRDMLLYRFGLKKTR